jgi:hypothetical protein
VTIVERNRLSNDSTSHSSSVPQARHPQAILQRGLLALEQFFPELRSELIAAGALPFNMGMDRWYGEGQGRPHYESRVNSVVCSRPLLEWVLQRLLLANHPNVKILSEIEVYGLLTDKSGSRAIGVHIRHRSVTAANNTTIDGLPTILTVPNYHKQEKEPLLLLADLIVDASGRNSRADHWLTELGFIPPRQVLIDAHPGYATCIYKRKSDQDWLTFYAQPYAPANSRGAVAFVMEDNQVQFTLIGINKDYPPTDEVGFLEFARSLPIHDVYDWLRDAEPVSSIIGYRRAENVLRHYEALPKWLESFLITGDSVYLSNPIYGQGMTISALCAIELDQLLQERGFVRDNSGASVITTSMLNGLAEQFQKRLMPIIIAAWQVSTGEDLRWPNTTLVGDNPVPDFNGHLVQK